MIDLYERAFSGDFAQALNWDLPEVGFETRKIMKKSPRLEAGAKNIAPCYLWIRGTSMIFAMVSGVHAGPGAVVQWYQAPSVSFRRRNRRTPQKKTWLCLRWLFT